jgi:hypothetical protein
MKNMDSQKCRTFQRLDRCRDYKKIKQVRITFKRRCNSRNSLTKEKPMNNSSFPKQSTKMSGPLIDQIKLLAPKVELEEKLIGGPLDIVENQENINEMNQKNKQKFDKTCKQHKEKKKK